jgi:hypothetical protein
LIKLAQLITEISSAVRMICEDGTTFTNTEHIFIPFAPSLLDDSSVAMTTPPTVQPKDILSMCIQ